MPCRLPVQDGRVFDSSGIMLAIATTFLLAGFVKGVIGLGLPTVAIGLLGLIMAPAQAAALIVIPSLVTNVWQFAAGPRLVPLLRRLWMMMLGVCAGVAAGAGILTGDTTRATAALGFALILYAAVGLASVRIRVPEGLERWLSPAMGAATGLVTAATGVFVIPAVPYLQALALEKDELVQALGLSFTVSTLALAAVLAGEGLFRFSVAGTSVLALVPAAAGMLLGQQVRNRIRPAVFRSCLFIGLLVLGLHLVLRSLT